jgi:Acetyltransferase (GNAT) family
MLEFERNSSVDIAVLGDFFARCGWQEADAEAKLEWVLAASLEWVVCKLDGDLIGFGRSCRLGPMNRVVFDVLVDARFRGSGLRREIVRLLSENAGRLEEVSVFREQGAYPAVSSEKAPDPPESEAPPEAPPGAYLGRRERKSTSTRYGSRDDSGERGERG